MRSGYLAGSLAFSLGSIPVPERICSSTYPTREPGRIIEYSAFFHGGLRSIAFPAYLQHMDMPPRIGYQDCLVGWVCSLPVEFAAARVVLDEEHESDANSYALGLIGNLPVAMLRLEPNDDGADVMARLITSKYTRIRFVLVVGVGSGVPSSSKDIRLGDVVVNDHSSGIVRYEMKEGKPKVLNIMHGFHLGAVAKASQEAFKCSIDEFPDAVVKTRQSTRIPWPGAGDDILFGSEYDHEGGTTCDWCDTNQQKSRRPRDDPRIRVFHSTIASGNQVVRDGRTRDRISTALKHVSCLETEMTDVLAGFPSLVFRGICDYADSHTNNKWRPYAAANAAVYARFVLSRIKNRYLNVYSSMEGYCKRYLTIGKSKLGNELPRATSFDVGNTSTSTLFSGGIHLDIQDVEALPFRMIKPLGKGGSAVVNMVEDMSTGRKFAHKTFGAFYGKVAFEKAKQSFHNEIDIMKRLSFNPHIIEVFATYTCGRELGMLLSPVASDGSLADFLVKITDSAIRPFKEQEIVLRRSFGCLASGLAYIHKHTIRHKDIKPQNILIHYGRIIYADFGIALDANYQDTTTVGRPDGFTKRYCAPEVAAWGPRNRKSDIFSLGCVFVEILSALTSNPALSQDDSDPYWERIDQVREALLRCSAESRMSRICHDMLEPQQDDRSSAAVLLQDIALIKDFGIDVNRDRFCDTCVHEMKKEGLIEDIPFVQFHGLDFIGLSPQSAIKRTLCNSFLHHGTEWEFTCIISNPRYDAFVGFFEKQYVHRRIWNGERELVVLQDFRTPSARQTLALVYAELKDIHYICRHDRNYEHVDIGWFRTTVQHITRVVEKYSVWMNTAPYTRIDRNSDWWVLNKRITKKEIEELCRPVSPDVS